VEVGLFGELEVRVWRARGFVRCGVRIRLSVRTGNRSGEVCEPIVYEPTTSTIKEYHVRKSFTLAAAGLAVLALPTAASADSHTAQRFSANIGQANETGASANAELWLDGNDLTVRIDGSGFFDGFPHAMHFHGEPGGDNVCGPLNPGDDGFEEADADGDGFLSVVEGVPAYGPVTVSLTTEGDTSPDSALAVDRFPTSSTLDFERTFGVSDEVADNLSSLHIVIHGADLTGSGEIGDLENEDGTLKESSLDPDLPFEATAVAACGQIVTTGTATGPDTGAGGTAPGSSNGSSALLAGLIGVGALGTLATRRRGSQAV
jgi:hypothetical protein